MPNFDTESLLRWFHFVALVLAGGAMPVCLVLSGFEDTQENICGLSAVIWKKFAVWGLRFGVLFGVSLLFIILYKGGKPFSQPHLMFAIGITPFLVWLCESTPRSLGAAKRGSAMMTLVLFLITSFIVSNGKAFFEPKPTSAQMSAPASETQTPEPVPIETPMLHPQEQE